MIYEGYVNGCEKIITTDVHEILKRVGREQVVRINVWTDNGQLSHRFKVSKHLIDEEAERG